MRLENQQLILERKDCRCDKGTQPKKKWKHCTKCNGTGKRGSGRCRECNPRGYYNPSALKPGYVWWMDWDDPEPCSVCNGNYQNFVAETYTDNLPKELVAGLPITVVRSGRTMGWAEQYLGAGVYTSIDYGAYKVLSDEELIDKVREGIGRSSVQACKMVKSKDDMEFAAGLMIVTGDQGYSVVPQWLDTPGVESQWSKEVMINE